MLDFLEDPKYTAQLGEWKLPTTSVQSDDPFSACLPVAQIAQQGMHP